MEGGILVYWQFGVVYSSLLFCVAKTLFERGWTFHAMQAKHNMGMDSEMWVINCGILIIATTMSSPLSRVYNESQLRKSEKLKLWMNKFPQQYQHRILHWLLLVKIHEIQILIFVHQNGSKFAWFTSEVAIHFIAVSMDLHSLPTVFLGFDG